MLVVLQENKTEHRLTWLLGAHLSFHMEGETCSLSEPTIWHFCVNTGSKNPATVEDERKLFSVWLGAGPRMAHHFRKAHSWWQNPFGAWVTEIPPVSAACICGYVFKVPPPRLIITSLYSEDSEEGWCPHACGRREELAGVGYPVHRVGSKERTQVIRLGRRRLRTLNLLTGPRFSSESWHSSLNFKFTLMYFK